MPPSLTGVWLKIERAKEHRDALQKHIAETFAIEANLPRLGVKFEPDSGEYVLFVDHMPDLSDFIERCAVVTGEVSYQLVSALDHLAYQLALIHTGGNIAKPKDVMFPFTEKREAWPQLQKRWLSEIDPAHAAVIERYQGYHRIDEQLAVGPYFHPLSLLREELQATDKHRLLIDLFIPTTGLQNFDWRVVLPIMLFGMTQNALDGRSVEARPAKLGAEVMRAMLPPGAIQADMDVAGYITPTVAIAEGRSLIPVLDKIAAVVIKIVREFEPFF
jgi:hypothetical protein